MPSSTIKIPRSVLRDLVLRAEENGHSIEFEIAMRLMRSLERDLEMVAQDNEEAYQAFMMIDKL